MLSSLNNSQREAVEYIEGPSILHNREYKTEKTPPKFIEKFIVSLAILKNILYHCITEFS